MDGCVSPSDELYLFAVHNALKYGWVSIPYLMYTNGVVE